MNAATSMTRERSFQIINPGTGNEVASYPLMSSEEVNEAVARARKSFSSWSNSSLKERSRILLRATQILADNAGRYADEISAENGKTRFESISADIFPTADLMKHYAKNLAKYLKPVKVSGTLALPMRKAYYRFEPKGVIGVISPWNYPFSLSAGPVISAIAAGNTVVLKPSSQTTRSGLIVKEILDLAGLPSGVVEVVTGNGSLTGQALIDNEDLDMLYFTGSTQVGRAVNMKAAERLIPAVMELGGKDVAIVTRNADLDRAAAGIAWSCFSNCGQTCISTEIILVDRSVYEPFVEKFLKIVQSMKVGQRTGEIGPLTMASQRQLVEDQLEDARQKGAKVLAGGVRPDIPGLFYPPTVLSDTTPEMKVRSDETFGPLKPIVPFDTLDEAIRMANSSEYGLSGCVYTKNIEEGRSIAQRLKTGSVNINDSLITPAIASLPFGGVKKSGIGRSHGIVGLREFTDIKSITEYAGKIKREVIWYPVPEGSDKVAEKLMSVLFSGSLIKRVAALFSSITIVRKILKKM